ILYFLQPPFPLPTEDREFLLGLRSTLSSVHKNISYRPASGVLGGFPARDPQFARLAGILGTYSAQVISFLGDFLRPYSQRRFLDYASFRPIEEEGRSLPLHKRNDLLHVDAFPSRPTHGGRILRVFTNIHASRSRVWATTDRFPVLATNLAQKAGLKSFAARGDSLGSRLRRVLHQTGLPVPDRSPYDSFMLRFHDYLKEDSAFQANCQKVRTEFPPMSTWLVFTDGVPHAVLAGQHALEQTFIIPVDVLVCPGEAPIRVLESLCGRALAEPLRGRGQSNAQ
ncbi:MAG TPA: Kdo hydroxylase family protein, partial [Terriglobales bacterium]|nr:Kdo hydroxylase family protein [Terriglobales bacterium]